MINYFNNQLRLILVFVGILICFACDSNARSEVENQFTDVMKQYRNRTLDVMVPKICIEPVNLIIDELKKSSGLNIVFRKFSAQRVAYSNLEGYVSMEVDINHSMMDLHEIRAKLTIKCFPDREIFFEGNDRGWIGFRKKIDALNKSKVTIHSIKIDDNKLSIFVNTFEYEMKMKK